MLRFRDSCHVLRRSELLGLSSRPGFSPWLSIRWSILSKRRPGYYKGKEHGNHWCKRASVSVEAGARKEREGDHEEHARSSCRSRLDADLFPCEHSK